MGKETRSYVLTVIGATVIDPLLPVCQFSYSVRFMFAKYYPKKSLSALKIIRYTLFEKYNIIVLL